jgi:L-ascorbate metabolism protein UlaG (beta-lactamase superfamily)
VEQVLATYIGGPTALFEFGGLRILTDPTFDPPGNYPNGPVTLQKLAGPALDPEALGRVHLVLLSHDQHADSFDHLGRTVATRADRVLTTVEGAERLGGNAAGLAHWQSIRIPAENGRVLRVTGTPARHGPEGGDQGPVSGFVLTLIDAHNDPIGPSLYISGETVWYDGMAEISRRFPVDYAVLDLGTMTAAGGVEAARAFGAATVVPLSYEGWAHLTEGRPVIDRAFDDAGLHGRVRWLDAGVAQPLRA